MSAVGGVQAGRVGPSHTTGNAPMTGPNAMDLLPQSRSQMIGMQGIAEVLFLLQGQLAAAQEELGHTRSVETKNKRDYACDKADDARREAQEAAEEGGVLDFIVENSGLVDVIALTPGIDRDDAKSMAKDVLKGALVVGALAATVLSAGTTAALCVAAVGVALSLGGQAVASSGVLGQDASKWVGLGMQVAGAGMMVGAGFMSGSTALTQAAALVGGGIAVLKGSDQMVTAAHQYDADMHNVDAERLGMTIKRLEKQIQDIIDQMKEDHDTSGKTKEATQGAIQALDQSQLIVVRAMRA